MAPSTKVDGLIIADTHSYIKYSKNFFNDLSKRDKGMFDAGYGCKP
ncbi:hypothetical protein MWMV18_MWMV18_01440 [Acinetobacter calcoaceticus]|nr:hypothetical protein MWMV18_MWMV18_01440 [Acinetobacter calcoaceticus]